MSRGKTNHSATDTILHRHSGKVLTSVWHAPELPRAETQNPRRQSHMERLLNFLAVNSRQLSFSFILLVLPFGRGKLNKWIPTLLPNEISLSDLFPTSLLWTPPFLFSLPTSLLLQRELFIRPLADHSNWGC